MGDFSSITPLVWVGAFYAITHKGHPGIDTAKGWHEARVALEFPCEWDGCSFSRRDNCSEYAIAYLDALLRMEV